MSPSQRYFHQYVNNYLQATSPHFVPRLISKSDVLSVTLLFRYFAGINFLLIFFSLLSAIALIIVINIVTTNLLLVYIITTIIVILLSSPLVHYQFYKKKIIVAYDYFYQHVLHCVVYLPEHSGFSPCITAHSQLGCNSTR